ncbi:hypothetical protein CALCODRAFT_86720 [Calocera cornea HHB12733]|uniref:Uncharacterized protein n=1 Tax=Calocera cornea HHB12733 TaxID=1353952 RepID=A0A165DCU1_9BASI|nr:hypothetical protein CALCODRAFT_86720 [Calocera cornea HHB12733]
MPSIPGFRDLALGVSAVALSGVGAPPAVSELPVRGTAAPALRQRALNAPGGWRGALPDLPAGSSAPPPIVLTTVSLALALASLVLYLQRDSTAYHVLVNKECWMGSCVFLWGCLMYLLSDLIVTQMILWTKSFGLQCTRIPLKSGTHCPPNDAVCKPATIHSAHKQQCYMCCFSGGELAETLIYSRCLTRSCVQVRPPPHHRLALYSTMRKHTPTPHGFAHDKLP